MFTDYNFDNGLVIQPHYQLFSFLKMFSITIYNNSVAGMKGSSLPNPIAM